MTPSESILAAFPGDDELHRSVRFALLRLLFAGMSAETEIHRVAAYISNVVDEPPQFIWSGPDAAKDLASHLRALAFEVEKAASALNAAKPHWSQFSDSIGEKDVVAVRLDRGREQPDPAGTPF